ncbi:MAG: DUF2062 domain-containing protein [Rhodobacteraceae bacterium]|nr:DUF2062 domain-containing protein [Paracoccaceae bacterium]
MVFKRRERRPVLRMVAEFFYPRGGWSRAAQYIKHRLSRLPDAPHRIARGIAAGVFVSFTPMFGFHFMLAALVAWVIRGNVLAALLATFVGNPLTFPLIMAASLDLGNWILGIEGRIHIPEVIRVFTGASRDLWHNIAALYTGEAANWDRLRGFFHRVFLPYLVGGIGPGLVAAVATHYTALPVVIAYQRRRAKKMQARREKRLAGRRGAPDTDRRN